jgi:prephenate dehydratase
MRVAYFGPEGTFTQAAALSAPDAEGFELSAYETIPDVVLAVQHGQVQRGVVPIENSIEGSVNVTLDTLALDAQDVRIVGETVLAVEQCLIAQEALSLDLVEVVISHPQATAQCRSYIRKHMPEARVMTSSSTAEAVRLVSQRIRHRWVAIGTRLAAELYDCVVLENGIEDERGNETRFVWLARDGADEVGVPGAAPSGGTAWKTAIVFWGVGAESPGWLVSCLSELAFRGVNLTRIESRPLRSVLGRYMFFVDLEGRDQDSPVQEALAGLRGRVNVLRTLGSFPAA